MNRKRIAALLLGACMLLTGCGGAAQSSSSNSSAKSKSTTAVSTESSSSTSVKATAAEGDESGSDASADRIDPPKIKGLTYQSEMKLDAAKGFQVFYYKGGYKYIYIPLGGSYLVVPKDGKVPKTLPEKDTQVIQQPLSQIYLAATGAMSFFDAIGSMDKVTMTGTDKDGWYIDAPKAAFDAGTLQYAGKYSAPDYEMLVDHNCDLAIESTMIFHAPEVEEMLEDLDIPVLIDRSSYELTAFGRIEWIKVYGALMNQEDKADAFYKAQKKALDDMGSYKQTGKTVCFFSINTSGQVVVRKTQDFIPNMIDLAGGTYIFKNLKNPGSNSASVDLSMEEFYHDCVNADYLVYNATIEQPLGSVKDLTGKDDLFSDFKAVKNGNVWQVDKKWYQSTATVGSLIKDFHIMLSDGDISDLTFLSKVPE